MIDESHKQEIAPAAAAAIAAGTNIVAAQISKGSPRRQYKWNKRAMQDANALNRENQQWLLQQQRDIQAEQRQYDSPKAQMQRYLEAGLNPHLIYGNGSSAGGAFPIDAGSIAPARLDAPDASYGRSDIAGDFIRGSMAPSAIENTQARTQEISSRMSLRDVQTTLLKNNPYYDPDTAKKLTNSALAVAKDLEQKADWSLQTQDSVSNGERLMNGALQKMWNDLGIQATDAQIKAEILDSKKFENWMNDQKEKFMSSGDINPGMWLEFFKQAILKFL